MEIKIKVGKVTFSSRDSGAFIQPIQPEEPEIKAQMPSSIQTQVFVSPEFLSKLGKPLEVGQLVRYEVADDETLASKVEPVG
jgi:hypothetical protein